MSLHDPNNPRHARIFDLLRHGDPSVETDVDDMIAPPAANPTNHQDDVKQAALRSFSRSDVVDGALEPGRNHKLF